MRRVGLIVLLALALSACQALKPDADAVSISRALYDDLRMGRNESLQALLPASLRTPAALAQVLRLKSFIPPGEPKSVKVVAANHVTATDKGEGESLSLEYDYGDQVALLQTGLARPPQSKTWQVVSLKLVSESRKALARNAFTLAGKPPLQLAYLGYAILVPLLILGAVAKAARTPNLKRRWLWVALSFLGLFTLQMDWTTGQLSMNWFSVQVVGFGINRGASAFDPWIVTSMFPLGALLILGGLWANPMAKRPRSQRPG